MNLKSILPMFVLILFAAGSGYSDAIWSDEFDGTDIDKTIWTYDVGGWGFGNGQLEYNTARSENSYIESGSLVIKAVRENYFDNSFTSARMLTQGRFAFKYGTLEARIKLPNVANGLWPAFWLLGNNFPGIAWPDCGEIDILESGSAAGIAEGTQNQKINCAIHFADASGEYGMDDSWVNASDLIPGLVNLSLDYHLYKIEWTPTYLKFFLDGIQFGEWDITPAYLAEYHQPAFPIVNIAIGGWNYVQINDPAGITALPTAGSSAELRMDWIRLEDNGFTEIYLGADAEENDTFGVFTETTPVASALVYGDDTDPGFVYGPEAALYPWNNMTEAATPATPSEGSACWTFDVGAGGWYGLGVFLPNFRNMKNYSDGYLHFDIQTTLTNPMKVGIKSSRGGEFWLPLGNETAEFGFARDGAWHSVRVPLNRFANIDFNTIHQMFMVAADSASASTTISFDNIYWEPSAARATPANGNFGVYTEDAVHKDAGEFALGVDGNFFVWENTLIPIAQNPYEGSESISLQSAAGLNWFGAAFTPNVKYNLTAFSYPESKLRFALKTSSTVTFQVGMKSGNMDGVGQKWIPFVSGSDPYGFVRDGNWHVVEIPMSDFTSEVDLFEVAQLFQILGINGPISNIEIDDICFTGGGAPLVPDGGSGNTPPSVSITSPANGTFFNPGDNVTIIADANDPDGTITKVEFLEGLNLLGEDLISPYRYTVNSVSEGTYIFRARATDSNDVSRTSSPVTIYVGTPALTRISVSPSTKSIEEGKVTHFSGSGFDQFGLEYPLPAGLDWSVSGGGVIDENGYFAAVDVGGPYIVTATEAAEGILSDTADVEVFVGGLCTGQPANGDYTWEASGIADGPAITFIPSGPGIGDTTLILYYSNTPTGVFPGYLAQAGVPLPLTGVNPGDLIYFYHTYNTPSGQHTTFNDLQIFQVGNCPPIVASDFNRSGRVDLSDFAYLAMVWLGTDCDISNDFCGGADHAGDGDVDIYDLAVLMYSWLKEGSSAGGTGIFPIVRITSPSEGRVFAPGTVISVEAEASDADGTVMNVEFYEGEHYLGEDLSSPYSYTWTDAANAPEGQYVLTAVVTDNDGLSTTSEPVMLRIETEDVPSEFITNGGFEDDTTGWTLNILGAGSTMASSTESPKSGSYSAKFVTDWQGGSGVKAEVLQTVSGLSAGTSYTFDLWVKGLMGTGGVAWAEIKWFNATGAQVGGTGLINLWSGLSNTPYQQKGGTYLTPAGTISGQVSIRLEGGALAALNTLYVDDVSFFSTY
jgi:hypothetical protein